MHAYLGDIYIEHMIDHIHATRWQSQMASNMLGHDDFTRIHKLQMGFFDIIITQEQARTVVNF